MRGVRIGATTQEHRMVLADYQDHRLIIVVLVVFVFVLIFSAVPKVITIIVYLIEPIGVSKM